MSLPRGLANRNPGNIIITPTLYVGEVFPSQDSRFKTFSEMRYGYRAMFKLLRTYILRGQNTIKKIVSTWAPEPEAWKVRAYIDSVSSSTGINENRVISADDYNTIAQIVAAMSKVENGVPANMPDVYAGMRLAMDGTTPAAAAASTTAASKYTKYIPAALAATGLLIFLYNEEN